MVGTKELIELATDVDGIKLGRLKDERSQRTALGMALSRRRDMVFDRFRIETAGTLHRASLWCLVSIKSDDSAAESIDDPVEVTLGAP